MLFFRFFRRSLGIVWHEWIMYGRTHVELYVELALCDELLNYKSQASVPSLWEWEVGFNSECLQPFDVCVTEKNASIWTGDKRDQSVPRGKMRERISSLPLGVMIEWKKKRNSCEGKESNALIRSAIWTISLIGAAKPFFHTASTLDFVSPESQEIACKRTKMLWYSFA